MEHAVIGTSNASLPLMSESASEKKLKIPTKRYVAIKTRHGWVYGYTQTRKNMSSFRQGEYVCIFREHRMWDFSEIVSRGRALGDEVEGLSEEAILNRLREDYSQWSEDTLDYTPKSMTLDELEARAGLTHEYLENEQALRDHQSIQNKKLADQYMEHPRFLVSETITLGPTDVWVLYDRLGIENVKPSGLHQAVVLYTQQDMALTAAAEKNDAWVSQVVRYGGRVPTWR